MVGFTIKDIADSGTGRSFENEFSAPYFNYELLVMKCELKMVRMFMNLEM